MRGVNFPERMRLCSSQQEGSDVTAIDMLKLSLSSIKNFANLN